MKPYSAYKKTEVDWLPEIPAHWNFKRARFVFRVIDERSENGLEELLSVSHITGVTPRSEKNVTMFMAESYDGHKICRPDDLVINSLWAWMAALGISKYHGIVSSAYHVYRIRNKSECNPKFLDYLLRLKCYVGEYLCRSKGIWSSRYLLTPNAFFDIPVLLPPLEEQNAIVEFLEAKEAEIGKFIKQKRRAIELLKEQKSSIVNCAVTRGLDANAPLKPSGIDWLGEIPEHWKVAAVAYRYEVQLGKMLDAKRITGESLAPYLRNVDVQWGKINVENLPAMDFSENDRAKFSLKKGDLLVCEGGEVGRCAIWEAEVSGCFYQKALHRLRPSSLENDSPLFMFYLMFVASKRGLFSATGNVSTIEHLPAEKLRRHRFPFPPLDEQKEIIAYIERKNAEIDAAIRQAGREIELMTEYRISLVDAAITGKIDCRN